MGFNCQNTTRSYEFQISDGLLYISICFLFALPIKAAINVFRQCQTFPLSVLCFIKIFLLPNRAVSHTIIIVQTFGGY